MHITRNSKNYNFYGNTATGLTLRWGQDTADNPAMAPWPELADISISNKCNRNCSHCYRASVPDGNLMSLEDFSFALDALTHPIWGTVFQIAIGGGEPLEHPSLITMLDITKERGIVPNLTTNGDLLNSSICAELHKRIGAIALSTIDLRNIDHRKVKLLLSHGLRTNIHYVLTRENVGQAIEFLHGTYDSQLHGINAIVFLTYKLRGRAKNYSSTLNYTETSKFIAMLKKRNTKIRIGFDSCLVPSLLKENAVNSAFVDCCECGFFSVYIDEKLNVSPCSFFTSTNYTVSLHDRTFADIWDNDFSKFREKAKTPCKSDCSAKSLCTTHCVYYERMPLCFEKGDTKL